MRLDDSLIFCAKDESSSVALDLAEDWLVVLEEISELLGTTDITIKDVMQQINAGTKAILQLALPTTPPLLPSRTPTGYRED